MELGRKLKELREERGLTQLQLARLVDLSPTHLSAIETGKVTNPGIEIVHRIADALDSSVSIGANPKPVSASHSLAYESPFPISDLEHTSIKSRESLNEIEATVRDKRLAEQERDYIADQVASYAGWLRDRLLKRRSENP